MSAGTLTFASKTENDPRWAAVIARDAKVDGQFYYSVKTTGVYCRPSCASRTARPENVRFHATREEAEQAGFRPCRRCKPDQPSIDEQHTEIITKICRFIERSEKIPSLKQLAAEAGLSLYYFHRVFKSVTGLTPGAYAAAHRARRIRNELGRGTTVTNAIYNAGFNSSSRFYEKSNRLLGMTPTSYRTGGKDTAIRFATGECSLGPVLVASSDQGVCAILLGDDPGVLVHDLQDRFPESDLVGGDSNFERLVSDVIAFIETPSVGLDLPLDIRGTVFQQRVWQALRQIPAGSTASYAEIARKIGAPKSARAVARACAANSLAVAIPCHRVVRSDGSLSGYRWGAERKRALLEREKGK